MQGLHDAPRIIKIEKWTFFFLPPTEQSCNLETCSPKLHDKAEYLLKSFCSSVFDIILQKDKNF